MLSTSDSNIISLGSTRFDLNERLELFRFALNPSQLRVDISTVMAYRTWTDEQLIRAVENNDTIGDIIKELGLKSTNSGNYQTVNNTIRKLKLDTSHFKQNKFPSAGRTKIPTENILVKNSLYNSTTNLKNRLLKENILEDKCYECDITHWKGKKLSLHIDHINGNRVDNRVENLRLLCPNCHSQTPTYCRGMRK